ncbi:MAG: hypothetical protein H0W02_11545 [Ktedonobacteraceae bacterium]|nr:hypothetical protein [Ktedonobacteraceae bacterium]
MVHRHNVLYSVLGIVFLVLAVLVAAGGLLFDIAVRNALFIVGGFLLVISLAYFHLSDQESRATV